MNIYEKLLAIQIELNAPKNQYNSFGKYKYRNCEDILDALKPLLKERKVTVIITDSIEFINTRFYIKAEVKLIDIEKTQDVITTTSFAREEDNKKGMDGSQITGASSSYARKYALNAMFAIDDSRDSDSYDKEPNPKANDYSEYIDKCRTEDELNKLFKSIPENQQEKYIPKFKSKKEEIINNLKVKEQM